MTEPKPLNKYTAFDFQDAMKAQGWEIVVDKNCPAYREFTVRLNHTPEERQEFERNIGTIPDLERAPQDPRDDAPKSLGQIALEAYEAYMNLASKPPAWSQMTTVEQSAWQAAAEAVRAEVLRPPNISYSVATINSQRNVYERLKAEDAAALGGEHTIDETGSPVVGSEEN